MLGSSRDASFLSELALRRSEFSGLFRRQGFEKLVETVVTKANRE